MDWQPIETAPRDGTSFFATSPDYEWPEVIHWENYPPFVAEEVGAPGYWTFSEKLLADIASPDDEQYTHWMPLPPPPMNQGGE